jgi:CheY-like chemotaxis protein
MDDMVRLDGQVQGSGERLGTILVVDDDPLISMSTVDMLEDLGHKVIEAHSGQQALEILRNDSGIDVMMTDHSMPSMTGLELARAAQVLRPGLPILLVTGYSDLPKGETTTLPRLGKPYQQSQLQAAVARLLAGE